MRFSIPLYPARLGTQALELYSGNLSLEKVSDNIVVLTTVALKRNGISTDDSRNMECMEVPKQEYEYESQDKDESGDDDDAIGDFEMKNLGIQVTLKN